MPDGSVATPDGSGPNGPRDPYERPADTPGAIVLDYAALLALPLHLAAAGIPHSLVSWLGAAMVVTIVVLAFRQVLNRRRGRTPSNTALAALAFDALGSALLLWILADRIVVRDTPYTMMVTLLAVVGVLYAYSMIRMPRRAARAWSPLWDR